MIFTMNSWFLQWIRRRIFNFLNWLLVGMIIPTGGCRLQADVGSNGCQLNKRSDHAFSSHPKLFAPAFWWIFRRSTPIRCGGGTCLSPDISRRNFLEAKVRQQTDSRYLRPPSDLLHLPPPSIAPRCIRTCIELKIMCEVRVKFRWPHVPSAKELNSR